MKYISHRGYSRGKFKEINEPDENSVQLIEKRLDEGYDVETDVFMLNGHIFLGHDYPTYEISIDFLNNKDNREHIIWHLKNPEALSHFNYYPDKYHFFWHEDDSYTLSSWGIPIIYPGRAAVKNGLLMKAEYFVLPEISFGIYGICSDYISYYKENNV